MKDLKVFYPIEENVALRINSLENTAFNKLQEFLYRMMIDNLRVYSGLVVLCIGSDRATGDALGPLVGEQIKLRDCFPANSIGNLENPVHAVNLTNTIEQLQLTHPDSFVIAVDASLGNVNDVGVIEAGTGPLQPGKGVKKQLPEVGHAYIRGVVNVGGFMENVILQSTRLSLVMKMSKLIGDALVTSALKYYKK